MAATPDENPLGSSPSSGGAPSVTVAHLRVGYDRRVFTDVSFTVSPGTTTVVSGPSGIGKTTLVRVLLGRHSPDRGEVTVGGRSVVGASPGEIADLHARTGVLFSGLSAGEDGRKRFRPGPDVKNEDPDDGVDRSATVGDNVRRARRGANDSGANDRIARCLADFDLADQEHRRARDLDVGTRRRLALARVFAADPTLVILDDPVAALDPADRDAVVAALRRGRESSRATILVACFDLATTRALGDELVTLVAGRVGVSGPIDRVLVGIESDRDFAVAFSVGGKRIEDDSFEALTEHKDGEGLLHFDQRVFLVAIAVLGVLFVVAIAVIVAFRLIP